MSNYRQHAAEIVAAIIADFPEDASLRTIRQRINSAGPRHHDKARARIYHQEAGKALHNLQENRKARQGGGETLFSSSK